MESIPTFLIFNNHFGFHSKILLFYIEKTIKALECNKFVVDYFETGVEAVDYLQSRIQNKSVAIGDSRTLMELKVHDALSEVNEDLGF